MLFSSWITCTYYRVICMFTLQSKWMFSGASFQVNVPRFAARQSNPPCPHVAMQWHQHSVQCILQGTVSTLRPLVRPAVVMGQFGLHQLNPWHRSTMTCKSGSGANAACAASIDMVCCDLEGSHFLFSPWEQGKLPSPASMMDLCQCRTSSPHQREILEWQRQYHLRKIFTNDIFHQKNWQRCTWVLVINVGNVNSRWVPFSPMVDL